MAVKHYPHTTTWKTEGGTPGRDGNGFPVPGTQGGTVEAVSRYENFRKGGAKEYRNKNGETVLQKGTIFVKKGQPYPKQEDTVTVTSPEFGTMFEGEVLFVYKGQLNTTIII